MSTRRKGQGGFTLLELLMVVIIIAILASIALPQYIRVTERARSSEALQILGAIRSAENRFRAQDPAGQYTATITNIDAEIPGVTGPGAIRFWTAPALNGTAPPGANATMTRLAGAFAGQTLGIVYESGNVCGNFAPMGTLESGC